MRIAEGFRHKGRIVYAVQYDLETRPKSSLIIWLDEFGNSLNEINRPADPGRRMVTVKPGESILHGGKPFRVARVSVYRSLPERHA